MSTKTKKTVSIRLEEQDIVRLKKSAKKKKVNLSEYVRELVFSADESEISFAKEAKKIIRSMQTEQNMVAQGIDSDLHQKKMMEGVKKLCVLLK